jgi:hypothetical protein
MRREAHRRLWSKRLPSRDEPLELAADLTRISPVGKVKRLRSYSREGKH